MNPLSGIIRKFGARSDSTHNGADALLQRTLDLKRQQLKSADPDTARRWQILAMNLEERRLPTGAARTRTGFRWALAGAAAASVAAVTVIVGLLLPHDPSAATYRTGRGEQSTVVLEDSSQVLLNHTSEIAVAPSGEGRRVTLRGEAFFRVRKTGEPFVVSTDVGTVQVLGTEFNVRVRNDNLEVAVLSGSVRVSAVNNGEVTSVVLTPGEISLVVRGEAPGAPHKLLFPDYPGWLHGKLLFQKSAVLSVCDEIESKFDVTVTIENRRLRQETITGAIDARSAETAVATIARLTGCSYRHEKNAYILY